MSRYKKRGWFGESHRHYLAAKGIKTRKYCADARAMGPGGVGAFGPSRTAFGRLVEGVQQVSDQRRKELAAKAGDVAAARVGIAAATAQEPSLEGLRRERIIIDPDTGLPPKKGEESKGVMEEMSETERALTTGLRPEAQIKKEQILHDLGIGTSQLENELSLFRNYNEGISGIRRDDLEGFIHGVGKHLERDLEILKAGATTMSDTEKSRLATQIELSEREIRNSQAEIAKHELIDKKIRGGKKLSNAERRFGGRAVRFVRDIESGKRHSRRFEDVEERLGLDAETQYELSNFDPGDR